MSAEVIDFEEAKAARMSRPLPVTFTWEVVDHGAMLELRIGEQQFIFSRVGARMLAEQLIAMAESGGEQ